MENQPNTDIFTKLGELAQLYFTNWGLQLDILFKKIHLQMLNIATEGLKTINFYRAENKKIQGRKTSPRKPIPPPTRQHVAVNQMDSAYVQSVYNLAKTKVEDLEVVANNGLDGEYITITYVRRDSLGRRRKYGINLRDSEQALRYLYQLANS